MKQITTKALVVAAAAAFATQTVSATNAYNAQGDLILAFRKSGFNDLLIDIGQASTYLNATATINLDTVVAAGGSSTYPTLSSLINHQFGGAAGVTWSVGGSLKPTTSATALYVTDPSDTSTAIGQTSMNLASTDVNNYGLQYHNATAGNTLVANLAAVVLSTSTSSYTVNGPKVTGQVGFNYESTIPATGSSSADFYTFLPGSTGTQASGHFVIDSQGNGQYVIASAPPPQPTLTITPGTNVNVISFSSAANVTYTLFYTNSAGLSSPVSTWHSQPATITGDGTVKSFTDTSADPNRFYRVQAHR